MQGASPKIAWRSLSLWQRRMRRYLDPSRGVRPWNRTGLRGRFDRLPGVVILELRWAEVAER